MAKFLFLKDPEGGMYRLDRDEEGVPVAAFKRSSGNTWDPLPEAAVRDLAYSRGEFEEILETDELPVKISE